MIYLHQKAKEWYCHFAKDLFSQHSASASSKFPENKTIVKLSKFTVSEWCFDETENSVDTDNTVP